MSLSSPSANPAAMAAAAAAAAASASAISRTQRCGVCEGCLAKACGSCVYCKDNPQFGGPGVKKQSCVARRCVRVLEGKLQREAMGSRAKKGCGVCDECRDSDCGACLVCMDKRFFQGHFLPDALCAKKKCSNARPLESNPLSPKLASSLTPEKKSRHHSSFADGQSNASLNGSPRKTPASGPPTGHSPAHYQQMYGGGTEAKKKKMDSNSGSFIGVASTSTSLRPSMPPPPNIQPVSASSNAPMYAQQQQPQPSDPVTLMERAFSYVIQQPPQATGGLGNGGSRMPHPTSTSVNASMVRHPTMLVQPRHQHEPPSAGAGNGASPPAGTTAPVYRSLPVATPLADNAQATWNPQSSKVLYPTSIETFSSSATGSLLPMSGLGGDGYIVTLDGDQLKQHLAGNASMASGGWSSSTNFGAGGDAEDIELQQKLIEFYQRDKQQHQQQTHQPYGGISNQGQYLGGQSASGQSRLPPSIVAEPIAPMGQSEVVLQQL